MLKMASLVSPLCQSMITDIQKINLENSVCTHGKVKKPTKSIEIGQVVVEAGQRLKETRFKTSTSLQTLTSVP